jgi:uncharacterized protein (TIGR02996 family)
VKTSCSDSLTSALVADREGRLRHLVAAWRTKRAPEIAKLVIELGSELDRVRPGIAGKTNDQRLTTWLELEEGRDDALTGWLLASPPLGETDSRHYTPRLARVARWRPDPRLIAAMMTLVEDNSYTTLREFWDPVFAQLVKGGDATLVPRLEAERARLASSKFFVSRLDKTIAALRHIQPAKLSESERRLVAQLGSKSDTDEARLLAAIYAAPHDDGPRLVYADYLQERNDPRGEYIALSCAKSLDVAGRRRVRELYARHRLTWLGPLEPAILEQKSFAFERGFLASCVLCVMWGLGPNDVSAPREQAIRKLQDHPAWATLHEVKMTRLGQTSRAPLIAHLKKLGVKVTFVQS